jgi:DNA-binding Lrp family transcriptional regulator
MVNTTAQFQPVESQDADRVRKHTDEDRLTELDRAARERIAEMRDASPSELSERIERLERESDVERVLEINAATLALSGLALGVLVNRKLLAIPAVVLAFLLQHGVQGWCPPLPVLRKLGFRSRQEIDAEKYAAKALRGDFGPLAGGL